MIWARIGGTCTSLEYDLLIPPYTFTPQHVRGISCMFISNYLITFVGKIFAYETHEVVQVVDLMNNFDSRSINFHTIS